MQRKILNLFLSLFTLIIGFNACSQDSSLIKLNSISVEYNFLLRPSRTVTLPFSVKNGEFYQQHFGDKGTSDRIIYKRVNSYQIGINTGFKFNNLFNHELQIGVGYQKNEDIQDKLIKNELKYDSSLGYANSSNVATVILNHSFNELYFNAAWLFKTREKRLNAFIGIGINLNAYRGTITAFEYLKDDLINQYNFNRKISFARSVYIPVGFQLKLMDNSVNAVLLGINSSIRFDNRISSGFNLSLSYQL